MNLNENKEIPKLRITTNSGKRGRKIFLLGLYALLWD